MKTYYETGEFADLELRIRIAVADKVYGGKDHEFDNLLSRLTDFFTEPPLIQNGIRRGIEGISEKGLKADIEKVARSIFGEYRNNVEKEIGEIYHPLSNFFMRSEAREARNWAVRYAALLDIIDKGNDFSGRVAKFDANVRALLQIYHNLRVHENAFLSAISYESYTSTMGNIVGDRGDLGRIDTDDKVIRHNVALLEGHSYCTSAAILYAFIHHVRQKNIKLIKPQLSALEDTRQNLSKKLTELGTSCRLGSGALQFYDGSNTVYDVMGGKK